MAQACGSVSTATAEYSIHLAWLIASGKNAGDESGQLDSPSAFLQGSQEGFGPFLRDPMYRNNVRVGPPLDILQPRRECHC